MDVLVALLGLFLGRFFNEVVQHLPRKQALLAHPASCPACGRSVPVLWLPVAGYLSLKGRCPHCGRPLPRRLPLVEGLTALLFWWAYRESGLSWETVFAWALASLAVMVSFIDLEHRLIPNKLVLTGIVLALPLSLLAGRPMLTTLAGGLAGFGLLFVIASVYPGAMGGGDVKLALPLGLFLGWPGVLVGLLFGFIAGGLIGLALLALRLRRLKDMIPFGPFLAAGALAAFWWGRGLADLYLTWVKGGP